MVVSRYDHLSCRLDEKEFVKPVIEEPCVRDLKVLHLIVIIEWEWSRFRSPITLITVAIPGRLCSRDDELQSFSIATTSSGVCRSTFQYISRKSVFEMPNCDPSS